ncbi:LysR family transcriptional regulator [Methylobrevis pamukkalensis]|uniref:HTH-type transcriptional regulator CynR n=1 Tax=Methylobrevis pamukkalensis TaxID=1439726 RepID=A0A1E3H6U1_9HYPH|nr:LysR family transcriptional regulator [Methylobrevis pamukkalensis]ODN71221.1 HTH-type transcriptional regulator CynR [Methylobrevis pamukkalensis]
MLVRHLHYFVALAREKHFARAAEICHVAQPTLSAAIHKLEEELDVRLIVRGNRFRGLTSEGERLLVWAQQILTDYDGLRDDLAGLRRGLSGRLRLGVVPAAMPRIAEMTGRFHLAHPAATVDIETMTSRAIQRGLEAFEIDAGVTYLDNEPLDHVRRVPLYRETYVFATGADGPLGARSSITWAEAAETRLCLLGPDMQNRRIIDRVAAGIGLTIRPAVTCSSYLGICSHLRGGGWSSIVPHTFLDAFGEAPASSSSRWWSRPIRRRSASSSPTASRCRRWRGRC